MVDAVEHTARVRGRIAMVTGASRGIGRASALALAREGASVVVGFHEDLESAEAAAEEIRQFGVGATTQRIELRDPTHFSDMMARTVERFGRIDILVNAAAVACWSDLWQVTTGEWDQQFDVNVRGMYFLSVAAAGPMRRQGYGRIINFSSVTSRRADLSLIPYGGTKGAVNMMTTGLAAALAPHGITVNAILPGTTQTDMNAHVLRDNAKRTDLVARTPRGRLGDPADVGGAVVYLASDDASYTTGAMVVIDGGFTA